MDTQLLRAMAFLPIALANVYLLKDDFGVQQILSAACFPTIQAIFLKLHIQLLSLKTYQ